MRINVLKPAMHQTLLAVLLLTGSVVHGQSFVLPASNADQFEEMEKSASVGTSLTYLYLLEHFELDGEKRAITYFQSSDTMICGYSQNFQPGIVYSREECMEVGLNQRVTFPKVSTEELKRFIEQHFFDPENHWESETSYGPIEGGAGCYYEIIQEKDVSIVDSYCGC